MFLIHLEQVEKNFTCWKCWKCWKKKVQTRTHLQVIILISGSVWQKKRFTNEISKPKLYMKKKTYLLGRHYQIIHHKCHLKIYGNKNKTVICIQNQSISQQMCLSWDTLFPGSRLGWFLYWSATCCMACVMRPAHIMIYYRQLLDYLFIIKCGCSPYACSVWVTSKSARQPFRELCRTKEAWFTGMLLGLNCGEPHIRHRT